MNTKYTNAAARMESSAGERSSSAFDSSGGAASGSFSMGRGVPGAVAGVPDRTVAGVVVTMVELARTTPSGERVDEAVAVREEAGARLLVGSSVFAMAPELAAPGGAAVGGGV